ncbi:MAG: exodeoxyribonuclease VII large subunit [Chloroflexota bacterium]|nr:exodeoxyribonuclease VII large subunit [Chloroflexota bacterium]
MLQEQTLSVSDLTATIRGILERDSRLQDVWVQGEISNFRKVASGHLYFTLKDGKSALSCVMWKSTAARMHTLPRDGDSVLAHGHVSVYDPQGAYQLYADRIRPVGVGDLYAQFEQLKSRLDAEGLFDSARKRAFPQYPRIIGVVTSADAAAFQDVRNVLMRRFPLVQVILSPTLVQGADAPPQIVRALARLNDRDDIDVILVCRGGGSIEDLWAFNDETVARAIAGSRFPVISGVGHETDFTICDFVADMRAPTPSAAAEILTPDIAELRAGVAWLNGRLRGAALDYADSRRDKIERARRALSAASPAATVRLFRQRLDDGAARLTADQRRRIALWHERVGARTDALHAASPAAILARGYVMVTDSDTGARVTAAADAPRHLTLQFHDGARRADLHDLPAFSSNIDAKDDERRDS